MTALFPPAPEPRPLRAYQQRAISMLRESIRTGHRRPILQLPTGGGKTRIAAEIILGSLSRERKAIFVVPRLSLIEQTVAAFEREGVWNVGVLQGRHFRTKAVQLQFQARGNPAGYIDCFTDRQERELTRQAFHSGELRIICNVGVPTVGIDWDVRIVILARPTKSEMLFVQIVGRGLRTARGKADCLILDHSDNHNRLGFVTDISYDELDDGNVPLRPERKGGAIPKECPSCHYLRPPKVHECPACGFAPVPKNKIVCEDGELVELRRQMAETMEHAEFFGMLRYYGHQRGYPKADGWASHKFKEKFGCWPNDARVRNARMTEPTPAVLSWIRSRNIAFAKAKAASG